MKPGREHENGNLDDMRPEARLRGAEVAIARDFKGLWRHLEDLRHGGPGSSLELLGCLFYRAAYMLDHESVAGRWVYRPPRRVTDQLQLWTPTIGDVPVLVYLHYVEALSLNEDVKYRANVTRWRAGAGRPNNMTTLAHVVAVLLGRARFTDVAGPLASSNNVAPLSNVRALDLFPLLRGVRP